MSDVKKPKREARKKIKSAFAFETISRKLMTGAEYNPRVIDDGARKRLRAGMEKNGYLGGIVWNRRTGNIVSGHQRVSVLDADNNGTDYELVVTVVEMDEAQEKAANLLFNNYEAQGGWDLEKLRKLFRDTPNMDISAAGYEHGDLVRLFGVDDVFDAASADDLAAIADKMRATRDEYAKSAESNTDRDNPDFYFVVVCRSVEARDAFLEKYGLPPNKFQDVRALDDALSGDAGDA